MKCVSEIKSQIDEFLADGESDQGYVSFAVYQIPHEFDIDKDILIDAQLAYDGLPQTYKQDVTFLGGMWFILRTPEKVIKLNRETEAHLRASQVLISLIYGNKLAITGVGAGEFCSTRKAAFHSAFLALQLSLELRVPYPSCSLYLSKRNLHLALQQPQNAQFKFDVHYQPKRCPCNSAILSYEALLRLVDKNGTPHTPYTITPPYARYLAQISAYRLDLELVNFLIKKTYLPRRDFPISINIPASIINDAFVSVLQSHHEADSEALHNLEIEILETHRITDETSRLLKILHDKFKIKILLDDFGVDFSNICAISRLPPESTLKIDMSFVYNKDDPKVIADIETCRLIILLAKAKHLHLVIESVDNPDLRDALLQMIESENDWPSDRHVLFQGYYDKGAPKEWMN